MALASFPWKRRRHGLSRVPAGRLPDAAPLGDALASAQYAADLNEVKAVGRVNSATRTSDQTELARLWQAIGPIDENRAARSVAPSGNSLVENARLFALLNMATCD